MPRVMPCLRAAKYALGQGICSGHRHLAQMGRNVRRRSQPKQLHRRPGRRPITRLEKEPIVS
jgi:hypothetical protein